MKTLIKQIAGTALFFLLACPLLFSQTQITGSVQTADKQPLPYANVLLVSAADSSLVKGEISADDGAFAFKEIVAGDYRIMLSTLGYEEQYSPKIQLKNGQQLNLPPFILQENVAQLDAVTVTARKPLFEQKIDRMVVNIANSVTSAGSNALELLERSPGVVVDRMNGVISMAGKNRVSVMINGKISRMSSDAVVQMLEGMSADNIESIELITTPPSNFDAEGNAGFINIVLKQIPDEGVNGSYSLNAGYGIHEKFGGSLNLNYRKNKVNLFGDYSYSYNRSLQVFTNYRSIEVQGIQTETDSYSDRDPTLTQNHNLRLGADFQLSKKTVLGALATWSQRDWTMDAFNDITISESGIPVSTQEMSIVETNIWNNYLGNNGRLSLNINDLFWSQNFISFTDDPTLGFQYEGQFRFSERSVRFTYSRNFGNNKVKGSRRRETGSAEEQQRVN